MKNILINLILLGSLLLIGIGTGLLLSGCNGVTGYDSSTTDSHNDNSVTYLDLKQKADCESCALSDTLLSYGFVPASDCESNCDRDNDGNIDGGCLQNCNDEAASSLDTAKTACYTNFECPQLESGKKSLP